MKNPRPENPARGSDTTARTAGSKRQIAREGLDLSQAWGVRGLVKVFCADEIAPVDDGKVEGFVDDGIMVREGVTASYSAIDHF